jgi:hypothetical protein
MAPVPMSIGIPTVYRSEVEPNKAALSFLLIMPQRPRLNKKPLKHCEQGKLRKDEIFCVSLRGCAALFAAKFIC